MSVSTGISAVPPPDDDRGLRLVLAQQALERANAEIATLRRELNVVRQTVVAAILIAPTTVPVGTGQREEIVEAVEYALSATPALPSEGAPLCNDQSQKEGEQ